MFDVILNVGRALAAVAGYYEERRGADAESHVKSGLAIGIVGLLLSVVTQLEIFIRTSLPGIGTVPTLPSTIIPVVPGMEALYAVVSLLDFLVIYGVAVLVAKLIGFVGGKIR